MIYHAEIERTLYNPGVLRLHVWRLGDSAHEVMSEVLIEDGTWQAVPEGAIAQHAGLPLPAGSLVPIAEALARQLGNALPSQAEVAVLREVLAKEQARVDDVLARGRW